MLPVFPTCLSPEGQGCLVCVHGEGRSEVPAQVSGRAELEANTI